MRTLSLARRVVSALVLAALAQAPLTSAEEKTPPRQKGGTPGAGRSMKPQTQTAPAKGAQTQTAPGEAGSRSVEGYVILVHPERRMVVIGTASNRYEITVTSQTEVTRDGQRVGIDRIQPLDRVDSCHFNAKRLCQKLTLTSGEKAGTAPKREMQKPQSPPAPPA